MRFFEAQDQARRNTWRLAALFVTAVVGLVLLTNLLLAVTLVWMDGSYAQPRPMLDIILDIPWQTWTTISLGVLVVITLASAFKYAQVSGGGKTVAESLGGVRIDQNTTNHLHRRLLNVVEEMAIASGIAVPPVYLLPEQGINAFAAGFTTNDAVIGITQGALEILTRAELQGVIGHEFSHIFNVDTRINLRLIAILHGILFIGMIGYFLLRSGGLSSNRKNNGAPILLLGLGMIIIGYSGTFFGNLIKAAVSRQREFLADASAVQFTRDPRGIADALKKIGGHVYGAEIKSPKAEEASHMFFGQAVTHALNSILATHPPLDKRILAIQPNWDGRFPAVDPGLGSTAGVSHEMTSSFSSDLINVGVDQATLIDHIGEIDQNALRTAAALIFTTDEELKDAARDPFASRALIYAMLLNRESSVRDIQWQRVRTKAEAGIPEEMEKLAKILDGVDEQHRLTLLELAVPALKQLSENQYRRFLKNVIALVKADNEIDLFEWVLHRLLIRQLKSHFLRMPMPTILYRHLATLHDEITTVLSAIASHCEQDQESAFARGMEIAELTGKYEPQIDPNFSNLNTALDKLRQLAPLEKPKLMKACAACALADGEINAKEAALLQGVAAALDCPLPPSLFVRAQ